MNLIFATISSLFLGRLEVSDSSCAALDVIWSNENSSPIFRFAWINLSTRYSCQELETLERPMLRYVAQPRDARGFEAHAGVQAARDGPLDDGLLLLRQQLDQLLPRTEGVRHLLVSMIQVPHDAA